MQFSNLKASTLVENPDRIPSLGSYRGYCRNFLDPVQDPIGSDRILCRILKNLVGSCEGFFMFLK